MLIVVDANIGKRVSKCPYHPLLGIGLLSFPGIIKARPLVFSLPGGHVRNFNGTLLAAGVATS
jgi:hypothetical protein